MQTPTRWQLFATYTSVVSIFYLLQGILMLDFINKHPIPPEVPRMKQTTTNTTCKLFDQPTTPLLVYSMMKDLTKTVMSAKETPCNYPIAYIDPPFSSLNFTFGEQQDLQDADDLIFDNLDATHDLNLDSILDYIMGAEEKVGIRTFSYKNMFYDYEIYLSGSYMVVWKVS